MKPIFACALLALTLSACGSGDGGDDAIESGPGHALTVATMQSTKPRTGKLRYYGGPVMDKVHVTAVLWGAVDPAVAGKLPLFYKGLLGSTYFDWLGEYDTNVKSASGGAGTNQHIGRGDFAGVVSITPSSKKTSLTDSQIERELAAQVKAGALPQPDANTLFMVHFPPGVSIDLDGSSSCVAGGFCGYHGAFKTRGKRLAYAVLPDMGAGSGCDTGCGGGSALDRVTSVSSHELVESVTDPEVSLADGLAAPLAWYNEAGGEIGDLCAGIDGRLKTSHGTFAIQKEWSNSDGKCVLEGKSTADEIDGP